ncbi:hypothetical protein [Stenotrophomonas maltophilia]|uniref:hypothetical protein n=1 Tax=Stenotrophomonas maltophilia TaxID=40324 RepID=UPI001FA76430|nr:hypothetical protein [Stenotrophomonas maltophilia]
MSWFSRWNKGPSSLEGAIKAVEADIDVHLRSLSVDLVEHVTEFRDGRSDRKNGTNGHYEMRRWLQRLKDLRARLAHLERAEAMRSQIAAHLGVKPDKVDMDELLRLLREADAHGTSEPEPTHG